MSESTDYIQYLKDKSFIRWQLAPDETLEKYWELYKIENPESVVHINKAIKVLKIDILNRKRLDDREIELLLSKIQNTLSHKRRAKKNKRILISLSSIAAILILLFVFRTFLIDFNRNNFYEVENETIIGNLLRSENIQLITEDNQFTFESDVQIKVDKKGNTQIKHEGNAQNSVEKTISEPFLKLIVPYGKRSTLLLADGSKVWLNSGAVFEFPSMFKGETRDVFLRSGEIYLEVISNVQKPFNVHTETFDVKVYGTKFNVLKNTNESSSVVLVEGKVGLQLPNNNELILSPSELATITKEQTIETQKVNVERYTCWKDGYLIFDKAPMSEVLRQLSRYYNLSFDYSQNTNLQKKTCTGKIYLSENLDNVMNTVAVLSNTIYHKDSLSIFITNN